MSESQLGSIIIPNIWKIKHVPNHQPDVVSYDFESSRCFFQTINEMKYHEHIVMEPAITMQGFIKQIKQSTWGK